MSAEPIVSQEYKYGFSQPENYIFKSRKGLDYEIVEQISQLKGEPQWLLDFRKRSLGYFLKRPMPNWGGDLGNIDFQDIYYYVKPVKQAGSSWDEIPADIRDTFDKLGIPEAERKYLAGAGSQYESEVVYHKVRKDLEDQGVIFVDPDTGFREHEEIFRPYFATVIPPNDNKFAALNSAVFSGGSFIYIPKGVHVDLPLQAYFRINAQNMGQFERTLIIADEDSYVHYVEGCFLAGARVRTRDGEKLIEEIREGDEVLTHKGRYRRVYHTMERPYNGTIYNVRFYGDSWRELHITEEHPLLVVRGKNAQSNDFTPAWVYASDVRADDLLVAPASLADAYGKSPAHRDQNFLYLPIRDIDTEQMDTTVYNFSVEEDESYIGEGVISHNCTAPTYTTDSLHSAVVEIIVKRGARVRYTTIQNWSKNVYNLVTKRAQAFANATMEWVDGNLGSRLTMKYPAVWLMEPGARGEVLSVAFASDGQHQDAGGKMVHVAPHTSSTIVSKSISKGTGRSSYRGLLKVQKGAPHVKSNVRCDALLLDETSRTDTYPYIEIEEEDVEVGHEASVSKVGEEQLFYLMSRGLSESEAYTMIVNGFIEPIAKELPLEYAVELNRLIQLEMSGSVG